MATRISSTSSLPVDFFGLLGSPMPMAIWVIAAGSTPVKLLIEIVHSVQSVTVRIAGSGLATCGGVAGAVGA